MKQFITFFLFLLTLTTVSAQGIAFEPETTAWADILKKAKAENKIVFVDAYTTWCGPCKVMAKNIFPMKEVGDVFNAKFVNAKIDMEKGEGPEIAQKYGIRAYPTYIFVNGDGELVHRGLGSMPPEKFITVGQAASDPERQFFSLKKKYEGGERNSDFLKRFAGACEDAQEEQLGASVAEAYLATQKDWLNKENMDFILKFSKSIQSNTFAYLVKNQAAFEKAIGKGGIETQVYQTAFSNVANMSYNRAKREFDFAKAKEIGSKYLPNELVEKVLSGMTLTQHQMRNEVPQFLAQVVAHMDKYPSEDPQLLNQYAWAFYEQATDRAQLEKALSWSLKSISINDQYALNDTAAALYYKLANKQKAKEFAEKAIKQAKETGEDSTETQNLLKKIEAM
ncbi:MAG: thioredoxin fold domain-containing protein [Saprospiraceae bacterium]|nr:thioredoxin fold domain-containing protein [Saprospiraceae bacterium]